MSFWEQHKNIFIVIGAFLVALFGLWLFLLRGFAGEVKTAAATDKAMDKKRKELCNKKGEEVDTLIKRFANINRKLDERFADLRRQVRFEFPLSLIPEKEIPHRQTYVRLKLSRLQKNIKNQLEESRLISLTEKARRLGFDLPADYRGETLADNLKWLRQMEAIRHLIEDVILPVAEEKGVGAKNLIRIDDIKALEPRATSVSLPDASLQEFPVLINCHLTLQGLMRLLYLCDQPKTFHTIRNLEINSAARLRLSEERKKEDRAQLRGERWYRHYYNVTLIAAILVVNKSPREVRQLKPPPTVVKRRPNPVPH